MTDAPRAIWAYSDGLTWVEEHPDERMKPTEARYHHDDVVQELRKIAHHALDQWESCIESEYAGTSSYDAMIAEVAEQRAALVKLDAPHTS